MNIEDRAIFIRLLIYAVGAGFVVEGFYLWLGPAAGCIAAGSLLIRLLIVKKA